MQIPYVRNFIAIALFTGRAFRIDWTGVSPGATLAAVMEKPNVDWEAAAGDVGDEGETQYINWVRADGSHPPDAVNFKVFGNTDLAEFWPEARTVLFEINTGAINSLFYNRYHRQQVSGTSLFC